VQVMPLCRFKAEGMEANVRGFLLQTVRSVRGHEPTGSTSSHHGL
jgi:hypothetical protein